MLRGTVALVLVTVYKAVRRPPGTPVMQSINAVLSFMTASSRCNALNPTTKSSMVYGGRDIREISKVCASVYLWRETGSEEIINRARDGSFTLGGWTPRIVLPGQGGAEDGGWGEED
jgi:hypothetical protein